MLARLRRIVNRTSVPRSISSDVNSLRCNEHDLRLLQPSFRGSSQEPPRGIAASGCSKSRRYRQVTAFLLVEIRRRATGTSRVNEALLSRVVSFDATLKAVQQR